MVLVLFARRLSSVLISSTQRANVVLHPFWQGAYYDMAGGRVAIHCSGRDVAGRRTSTELGIKGIKETCEEMDVRAPLQFVFFLRATYCTTGYLLFPPMKEEEEEEDLKWSCGRCKNKQKKRIAMGSCVRGLPPWSSCGPLPSFWLNNIKLDARRRRRGGGLCWMPL